MKEFSYKSNLTLTVLSITILLVILHAIILQFFPNTSFAKIMFYTEIPVIIFALLFTIFSFESTLNLTKELSHSAIELIEVKHILKEDKTGYESFAVFKNNTPNIISLEYDSVSHQGEPAVVHFNQLGTRIVSFLYDKDLKHEIMPGSLMSVKIADMSIKFLKSQEFNRINKKNSLIGFRSRDIGYLADFNYFYMGKKKIVVPIYPYEYDISKLYSTDNSNTQTQKQELKSAYIFFSKEYFSLSKRQSYLKITKDVAKFYIVREDEKGSWRYLPDHSADNYVNDQLKLIQLVFFEGSDSDILKRLKKYIEGVIFEYENLTYVKSYVNNAYKHGFKYNNSPLSNMDFIGLDYLKNSILVLDQPKIIFKETTSFKIYEFCELIRNENPNSSGQLKLTKLTKYLNTEKIEWEINDGSYSQIKIWDNQLNKYLYVRGDIKGLDVSDCLE